MKAIIRISIASFFLMILYLPAAHAETLQEQLNNLVGPKQKYNTMLSPVYLRTNETIDDISPQSGSLTITQTDFVLPGRNGLDLVFKRIYKNDTASVQEMEVEYIDGAWVDIARSNNRTTSFYEDRYNLGIGMRFSFPNMEIKTNSDGSSHKFLHTESGDVYRLKENYVDGSFGYLPEGQTVKDVVVRESAAYSNGQADGTSKYVMAGKDGKKTYFAEDGRILGIVDRYGNTIRFEYATHTYNIEGESISKKLMSKITDSVGRVSTIEYVEDANYTVGPINNQTSYGAEDYYKASGNPNNNDSGDLKGKFQVILHLPGDKSMIYDKSAVLVSPSKHVIRTRLQRVFDTDSKPKFLLWYEQPDLGFTYFNNTSYSAYNRYENLVLVDDVKNNSMKRFVYNTYTKRLNEGSMQYRKIFESKSLVKKGFDPAPSNFLDKFIVDTKDKITYTYTNEADGYGVTDYKGNDEAYLKGTYRYYTQITDVNGSSTRFTYNGNQELILTEKQGRDHKEVVKSEHDEMKLVKKQETVKYQVTNGQPSNNSVKKIENFRYDEYGNMTNYTGPDAERDASGYPVNNERSVLYTYDINKFHILTQKTWKQDKNTTAQINYSLDEKGNVIKESKSGNDVVNSWINTDFAYDSYGNLIRKTVHDKAQDFVTWFEYGTDANGLDIKGAYLTKEYRQSGGKTYAKTYAYDFQSGNLLIEIDPRGNKTSYQYDVLGRVVKNIKPDQTVQEYQYQDNAFANFKILYTDANQSKFLYEYDVQGSLLNSKVLSQEKWNNLESMEYDSFGNLIKKVDANGHSTRFTYDSDQQIVEKSSYENDKTIKGTLKVDYQIGSSPEVPLLMTITNEEGYAKKYNYDILDRLIKEEVTPDRQKFYASTNTYDYAGNIVIETDDAKHTTQYAYDTQGRKTNETDALGNTTEYAYNNLDQKVSEKAPGGKITEWIYDDFGNNTVQKVYQSGSEDYFYTQIEYDGNQNPVKNTVGLFSNGANRDSSIVTFAYDGLNRVTDEYNRLDATTTTHTHTDYDANGNKLKIIDYGDSAGNRLLVRNFEYDYAGRVTLESGAAREKQADGKQIERGKYETRNEYDLAGNLLKKQIYNGSGYDTEDNVYNYRNQVISTTSPFNAKGSKIKRFQYDKVGNLIAETAVISGTERTTSYTYDGLGYAIGTTDPLGNTLRYVYDTMGNLLKTVDPRYSGFSLDQAPGIENVYDETNRLIKTVAFDGTSREVVGYKEYDGRGNIIKETDGEGYNAAQPGQSIGAIYRYNVQDQPVEVISAQIFYENQQQGNNYHFTKQFTYDGSGNVLSETDGLGQITRYVYDLGGRLKQTIYADGTNTSSDYDLTGNWIISNKDQLGRSTKTYNTIFGSPYLIEYPDGTKENFRYSAKGELLESVDQLGNSVYYEYDFAGNQISQKEFIRSDQTYSYYKLTRLNYDEDGNQLASETFSYKTSTNGTNSETSAGNRIEQVYDKAGRLIQVLGPFGRESKQEYDRIGNIITTYQKVTDGNYDITRNTYDSRNRLIKTAILVKTSDISSGYLSGASFDNEYVDRLQAITAYTYNKNDEIKTKTDARGNITGFDYDFDNQLIKKTDALKEIVTYQYDPNGNLLAETNPLGAVTRYEYDALNRMLRKSLPASDGERAITRYAYDSRGNLIKEISPNQYASEQDVSGSAIPNMPGISYTYDTMNRRNTTVSPDGRVLEYIQYDAKGQVAKVVDGLRYTGSMDDSKGTSYQYDGLGRTQKEINALGSTTLYEYDVQDNLVKQTDGRGNSALYLVNPDGTPKQITLADGGVFSYTYDKLGRRISETNPLGATSTYSYNAFGKEKLVKDPYGNTVENKYDPTGNLVSLKDKRGSLTLFSYDALNQLIEKKTPLELDESKNIIYALENYSYDETGNLLKNTVSGSRESGKRETMYTYYANNLIKSVADNSGFSSLREYDKNGNLVRSEKLRDAGLLDVEQYEYDIQNRMIKKTALLDETSIDNASSLPNLANLKDSNYPGKIRQITGYTYDLLGNKIQEINPGAYGFLSSDVTNRQAYTVTFAYDIVNRPMKITRKLGAKDISREYAYDAVGNKIKDKDERGFTTGYAYDGVNRLTVITDPEGKEFTTRYDAAGNKVSDTNAKGFTMTYTYDKLNRLDLTTDPYGVVIGKNIYDEAGNVIKKIDAKGYAAGSADNQRYGNIYRYDLANRVIAFIDPVLAAKSETAKLTTKYSYNAYGNLIKQIDALGNSTTYEYDNAGRLTKVVDAEQTETSYSYDRLGNKLSMKDGRGKVTQYIYGSFGLLQSVTDAGNQSTKYTYDLALNKRRMIDRLGQNTLYTYDNNNLLTQVKVEETGDQIAYEYDELGNRIRMTDASGSSTYTYNSKNQLLKILKDGKGQIFYTYDVIGNVETVTDAAGNSTSYHYDKSSRMDQVSYNNKETVYTYDKNGNRTSVQYEDGVKEVYSFDQNNRLLTLINKRSNGSEISSYRYTYDEAGRQISKTDSYGKTQYSYDKAGRIQNVEAPGKTTVYAYDEAGNRKSMLETYTSLQPSSYINPETQKAVEYKLKKSEYLYSSSNQLLRLEERMSGADGKEVLFKAVDYLYDSNGNQVSQRTGYTRQHNATMSRSTGSEGYSGGETESVNNLIEKVTQTYDGFNRLKKAVKVKTGDRVIVEFVYNGDGLRTKKTVQSIKSGSTIQETNYVYDRQHVILETDASGKVNTRYIRGINYIARVDQANRFVYYLFNGHGDVVQSVTAAGEVLNQYDYDVFGNLTLALETYAESIKYAGEFYDAETGLYYLRARYYDPYIGRFLSEDSYWGEDNNPLSLNLYTYAHNDPIQYVDPTGHAISSSASQSKLNQNEKAMEQAEHVYLGLRKATTVQETKPKTNSTQSKSNSSSSNKSGATNSSGSAKSSSSTKSSSTPVVKTQAPATSTKNSTTSAAFQKTAATMAKLEKENKKLTAEVEKNKQAEKAMAKATLKSGEATPKSNSKSNNNSTNSKGGTNSGKSNTSSSAKSQAPKENTSFWSKVGSGAKKAAVGAYNFVIGDDIKAVTSKDSTMFEKTVGAISLGLTVVTLGESKVATTIGKEAAKATGKLALKVFGKSEEKVIVKEAAKQAEKKLERTIIQSQSSQKLIDKPMAGDNAGSMLRTEGTGKVQTGGREMSLKEYARQEAEASKMYDSIRASTTDAQAISKNTGMAESRVQRIKDHVFNNEHIKSSGNGRFDPDYEISQAWQRLQKGEHTPKDIELLNHEIFESKFEGIFKTNYEKAHAASEKSGRVWKP